ncbi:BspA family leucine-rich repeat surface protein [Bacteroides congonensis]|uniref:BspA family leucine-rich repeat surface protein n=1 Tax=Bacteroides congonensis TaxID=1871006 RepID=UPI000933E6AB|nr:BspA family leucine-rich repeat surface protein [Bacteroides congonensis]
MNKIKLKDKDIKIKIRLSNVQVNSEFDVMGYDGSEQPLFSYLEYSKDIVRNWDAEQALMNRFRGDKNLVFCPLVDTSKANNMQSMFSGCANLMQVPLLDTSNVVHFDDMFYNCYNLVSVPQFNTSNLYSAGLMLAGCDKLVRVPLLNFSKAEQIRNILLGCSELVELGGFSNLSVSLDLSSSRKLTAESILNVINQAKDLSNEGGATLTLGTTNAAKLTEEQIAIATIKGWTIA